MPDSQSNSTDYSFKAFASQEFHKNINRHLIEVCNITPGQKVLELACGTGAASRLILERLRGARESLLIGVDVSSQALREAMDQLASFRDVTIQLVQTRAEQLSAVVKQHMDSVLFTNGIHYVADKDVLLDQVGGSLKSGGVFAFNTSFFNGAHPVETHQFYRRWMLRAVRTLKTRYNIMPVAADKVESRRQLTPEEYESLLTRHRFVIVRKEITLVPITLQGWKDISSYEDFIQGALPGVPLAKASAALKDSVQQVMEELSIQAVPRNWLTVVAAKA
ncbi:MAG: class I SAM-dependent methyltransferase [SAR202 cluster bacterium]|nr:class I SAM-dependent methyltransferase [SAR202 cluster bacterium]